MNDNNRPKPICSFSKLKDQLTRMGYIVEQGNPYKPIQIKDVDINELQRMEFTEDGIFVIDETDGKKYQVFLYKRSYHLLEHGKPRFHIRKCSTIKQFIELGRFNLDYRRANTESVKVIDLDNFNDDVVVDNLPLCKNCLNVILSESSSKSEINRKTTSAEFVELLKQADSAANEPQEVIDVDIRGYTRDWEEISYKYRRKHNFTCEICGISTPLEIFYMHTHHRNGIKTDNREENLQCLCIKCHANIDQEHKENFSWGQRKKMLDQFNKMYYSK